MLSFSVVICHADHVKYTMILIERQTKNNCPLLIWCRYVSILFLFNYALMYHYMLYYMHYAI